MQYPCIQLFGDFSLRTSSEEENRIGARKARELCSYLFLLRGRPHVRERLTALFWTDTPPSASRAYFRKALWQIQSALRCAGGSAEPLLLVDAERVQVNARASFWLDVAVFENTSQSVDGIPGEELSVCQAGALQQAVEIYHGDLLESWYYDWCFTERERLQHMYLTMLDKLMGYCTTRGQFEQGLRYGETALRYDATREQTWRRMMCLHYFAGDRDSALRRYERCEALLREELGLEPTEYTRSLHRQIRENQVIQPRRPDTRADPSSPSLRELYQRLSQLHLHLAELKTIVDLELVSIEPLIE
jgi:DNA-binding SARP family transcriptional activator